MIPYRVVALLMISNQLTILIFGKLADPHLNSRTELFSRQRRCQLETLQDVEVKVIFDFICLDLHYPLRARVFWIPFQELNIGEEHAGTKSLHVIVWTLEAEPVRLRLDTQTIGHRKPQVAYPHTIRESRASVEIEEDVGYHRDVGWQLNISQWIALDALRSFESEMLLLF